MTQAENSMTQARGNTELIWKIAEDHAKTVRGVLGKKKISFSLEAVRQLLEVDIQIVNDLERKNLRGMVVQRCGRAPKVYVCSRLGRTERNVFIAHMFGHIVERTTGHYNEYSFTEYREQDYTPHEYYADCFADALLMPKALVLQHAPTLTPRDGLALALDVDVPIPVAKRRIEHMAEYKNFYLSESFSSM